VARANAQASSDKFRQVKTMEEAFKGADIVYPKSWAPYKVMEQRTVLLRAGNHDGLKALEKKCLAQDAGYKNWHCDEALMKRTNQGPALYMHCLPAGRHQRGILQRGQGGRHRVREVPDCHLQARRLETVHHRRDDPVAPVCAARAGSGAVAEGVRKAHALTGIPCLAAAAIAANS
jgi:ornithine carbamoyltransferase